MKINELPLEDKKLFKKHVPLYLKFIRETAPHLSPSSHCLYSRALAFIAVENKLLDLSPEELCINLTQDALKTSDLLK